MKRLYVSSTGARHGAKQDSSRMIIDEPSNGIDAIEMNEEPSTSEHLMEIDDKDREAYRISELHEYQYYEQNGSRYQAEKQKRKQEKKKKSLVMSMMIISKYRTFFERKT